MTHLSPFTGPRLKVRRARFHVTQLHAAHEDHNRENPIRTTIGQDAHGLYAEFTVPGYPEDAIAILGDALHNMRSALDLLAVDLVRAVNGNTKNVYFPFCENPADLDKIIKDKKFHRAGDDAVDLLKSLKPHHGGNIALRAVHDLDIEDKHRATVLTHGQLQSQTDIHFVDGLPTVIDASALPQVYRFPSDSVFANREVVPTLHALVQLVDDVVEAFAALVAARS